MSVEVRLECSRLSVIRNGVSIGVVVPAADGWVFFNRLEGANYVPHRGSTPELAVNDAGMEVVE